MVMNATMLIKFTLIFLLVLLHCGCAVASDEAIAIGSVPEIISFSGVQDTYPLGESVEFIVHNNTNNDYEFVCAVLTYSNREGKWFEFYPSIDMPKASMSVPIRKIGPKQSLNLTWDPEDANISVSHRFKLYITVKPGYKTKAAIFSEEFMFVE